MGQGLALPQAGNDVARTLDVQQIASSGGESLAFPLFVGLALAVLAAVCFWMELLVWFDEAAKANEILKRASTAILATAVAVGTWYALAFLVLPDA
ncbi:MAG: hypothetical protein M3R38_04355 [Actinomycetota bacterium]|nr:hypothetical protein [Actinomycetota bacterium]